MEIESPDQDEEEDASLYVSAALRKSWFEEDVALSKLFRLNVETDISRSAFTPLFLVVILDLRPSYRKVLR